MTGLTFYEKVELAKALIPLLAGSTGVLGALAVTGQFTIRRLERELRRVRADRNRLDEAVGAYERVDDLRTETIGAIRHRAGRG